MAKTLGAGAMVLPATLSTTTAARDGMALGKLMPVGAKLLQDILGRRGGSSHDILPRQGQHHMSGIAARSIVAQMVKHRNVFALAGWDRANKPSVHEAVGIDSPLVPTGVSVAFVVGASVPQPTPAMVERDAREYSRSPARFYVSDSECIHVSILRPLESEGNSK
jgi:hypothetical protein